jgi:hypothetical protein
MSTTPSTYIVSSQISNEPVHHQLIENMEVLAEVLDAEIIIGAVYKENCNAMLRDDNEKTRWYGNTRTNQYILRDQKLELEGATLRGEVNIRPNAANPISAVAPFVTDQHRGRHAVFFHPNIAVESLPRPIDEPRQTIYTTGSVNPSSIDYYRRSVSESKARFHHSMGFLVIHGSHAFPVYAEKDGSFDFFHLRIANGNVSTAVYTHSVWGDLHAPDHDKDMVEQVMDLCWNLEVRNVVIQDAIDIQHGSHHAKSTIARYQTYKTQGCLTRELDKAGDVLSAIAASFKVSYIASNHHSHLDTFLNRPVDEVDPADLETYFELNLLRLREGTSAFRSWLLLNNIKGIEYSDFSPLNIGETTVYHGDKGICGAKGSPKSFAKGSGKTIVGHSHSEQIYQGVINPGCLVNLPQGYQSGLTKSTQGIVLVSATGKRSLITAAGRTLNPFTF